MKLILSSILFILSGIFYVPSLYACSYAGQPPEPGFRGTPTTKACSGELIFYTPDHNDFCCGAPVADVTYRFYWGDGDSTIFGLVIPVIPSASHAYVDSGKYNLVLVKTKVGFSNDTTKLLVDIGLTPEAGYLAPDTVDCMQTANFTDTSKGDIEYYIWDYGDGIIDTIQNPTHNYERPGTYTVTHTVVTFFGCSDIVSRDVVVRTDSALEGFVMDTIAGCNTISVIATGSIGISWFWDFGDVNLASESDTSNLQTTNYTYVDTGSYIITLETKGVTGCIVTTQDTIVADELPNVGGSDFAILEGCPCNNISFIATDATNIAWEWNFGDGNQSNINNPTYLYSTPGNYWVTFKGTSPNGCSYTNTTGINVCSADAMTKNRANNNWFFGNKAGLNFSNDSAIVVNGAQINTLEGASTVSDPITGTLLFYTDGVTVWDKNHVVMTNGINLMGCRSASQGSLIVPNPANENQYYIFSGNCNSPPVGPNNNSGWFYSIVDMTLRSGDGDVLVASKNTILSSVDSTGAYSSPGGIGGNETMTGTIVPSKPPICNNIDNNTGAEYWVIIAFDSASFSGYKLFKVSDQGVSAPIMQNIAGDDLHFYNVEFSNDGKLMTASRQSGGIDLYDFDPNTGIISNHRIINSGSKNSFSPDNTLLYTTNNSYIYNAMGAFLGIERCLIQYDLTQADINTSAIELYCGRNYLGDLLPYEMALGPDNRMYICYGSGNSFLGVVNNPNQRGQSCNYQHTKLDVSPGQNGIASLQNSVLFYPFLRDTVVANYTNTPVCYNSIEINNLSDTLLPPIPCSFYQEDTMTYTWDFGDGNTSGLYQPGAHAYSDTGTYLISLIIGRARTCSYDTFIQTIIIDSVPIISFIADSVCLGDSTSFYSTIKDIRTPVEYNWSTPINDTIANPKLVLPVSGNYSITVGMKDVQGCYFSDTNDVFVYSLPQANNSTDTICEASVITLNGGIGSSYLWSLGTLLDDSTIQNPSATLNNSVVFMEQAIDVNCGVDTGYHSVYVESKPVIKTIKDTIINLGTSVVLTTTGGQAYTWTPDLYLDDVNISNPTSSTPFNTTYIVTGYSALGCSNTDTVNITVEVKDFYIPNAFSPNGEGTNDLFKISGLEGDAKYLLKIFDRWGNNVFESTNKNEAWDGILNGKILNAGAYVYWLDVTLLNGQEKTRKGNITLLR